MKSQHQQRVEEFMRRAGQDVPSKPTLPDAETRLARAKLIVEEAMETVDALGCWLAWNDETEWYEAALSPYREPDLIKIIDGCIDTIVVSTGTLSACGVPDTPFRIEVDAANLRKFEGDAHRDANGKWVKPTGFVGPDIAGVLKQLEDA